MGIMSKNALMLLLKSKKDKLFQIKCHQCLKTAPANIKNYELSCPYCFSVNVSFSQPVVMFEDKKVIQKDIDKFKNSLSKLKFFNKIEGALKVFTGSIDEIDFTTEEKELDNISSEISFHCNKAIELIQEFISKV
jgi:hypothetical protein